MNVFKKKKKIKNKKNKNAHPNETKHEHIYCTCQKRKKGKNVITNNILSKQAPQKENQARTMWSLTICLLNNRLLYDRSEWFGWSMIPGNRYREIYNITHKYSDPWNRYIEKCCGGRYCISSGKILKSVGA